MRNPTILVIDDDSQLLDLCYRTMSPFYNVICGGSALHAAEVLCDQPIDCMILDLRMPVMNGFDLIKKIRAYPAFEQLPIMVISAYPDLLEKVDSHLVQAVLPKPFTPATLKALTRQLVPGSQLDVAGTA